MQVKKQQLEPGMEQQTGSKSWKEYIKAVYCHTAYLTSMQSTSCEMPGWMKRKLEWDCWKKYQYPQICGWHHPYGREQRGTKESLGKCECGEWKSWLKTQYSKNKDHGIRSHHIMENRWGKMGRVTDFIFLGSTIPAEGDCSHEI